MDIRSYLFDVDPYEGFSAGDYAFDDSGFLEPASVLDRVAARRPARLIEVGTWKGRSALRMARSLRAAGVAFELVCVDTWLGAGEMWIRGQRELSNRHAGLEVRHGYPRVYDRFLANVVHAGFREEITPLPLPGAIAARVLAAAGYSADFIYIDASHDEADVAADLAGFWPLVSPGGALTGDDYGNPEFPGVKAAVDRFCRREGPTPATWPDHGWCVDKA